MILFGGCFLFKDAGEGVIQLVGAVSLIFTFGVAITLDERDRRRGRPLQ